jgi:hypothetical protein
LIFFEAALVALKMLSCACDGSLGLDFHPNQGCLLMHYLAKGRWMKGLGRGLLSYKNTGKDSDHSSPSRSMKTPNLPVVPWGQSII